VRQFDRTFEAEGFDESGYRRVMYDPAAGGKRTPWKAVLANGKSKHFSTPLQAARARQDSMAARENESDQDDKEVVDADHDFPIDQHSSNTVTISK